MSDAPRLSVIDVQRHLAANAESGMDIRHRQGITIDGIRYPSLNRMLHVYQGFLAGNQPHSTTETSIPAENASLITAETFTKNPFDGGNVTPSGLYLSHYIPRITVNENHNPDDFFDWERAYHYENRGARIYDGVDVGKYDLLKHSFGGRHTEKVGPLRTSLMKNLSDVPTGVFTHGGDYEQKTYSGSIHDLIGEFASRPTLGIISTDYDSKRNGRPMTSEELQEHAAAWHHGVSHSKQTIGSWVSQLSNGTFTAPDGDNLGTDSFEAPPNKIAVSHIYTDTGDRGDSKVGKYVYDPDTEVLEHLGTVNGAN